MPAVTSRKGLVAALAAAALLPLAAVLPAAHAAPALPAAQPARTTSGVATVANRPPFDHTSSREARRVDRVPTPKLGWYPCYGNAECATTKLPLDYDHPHGAKTLVAVLRVKARDQKHKIGSLFVNPGGPGGSGTGLAQAAPFFLGAGVLARFDVVGIDPRGTNFSDQVACFTGNAEQGRALAGLNVAFPYKQYAERSNRTLLNTIEAFGGRGYHVTDTPSLTAALSEALNSRKPALINAVIDPTAGTESGHIQSLNPRSAVAQKT